LFLKQTKGIRRLDKTYKVEKLIGKAVSAQQNWYYIKWEGYGSQANSWTTEENMSCDDLKREFEESTTKIILKIPKKLIEKRQRERTLRDEKRAAKRRKQELAGFADFLVDGAAESDGSDDLETIFGTSMNFLISDWRPRSAADFELSKLAFRDEVVRLAKTEIPLPTFRDLEQQEKGKENEEEQEEEGDDGEEEVTDDEMYNRLHEREAMALKGDCLAYLTEYRKKLGFTVNLKSPQNSRQKRSNTPQKKS
jgi:hypothetical protein